MASSPPVTGWKVVDDEAVAASVLVVPVGSEAWSCEDGEGVEGVEDVSAGSLGEGWAGVVLSSSLLAVG